MLPNFCICNFIIKKKKKKTKTTKTRWGFLLDCRCQACSEDREVPVTAQGQFLSSWPPSYSCGDFKRWRWFAENRYSRKQRRNLLVVIYDSSLPSSWGWRVDSEATEWPPQQLVGGRVEVLPKEGVPSIGKDILDLMMHCWWSLYECIQTHFPIVKLDTFFSLPCNSLTY